MTLLLLFGNDGGAPPPPVTTGFGSGTALRIGMRLGVLFLILWGA